MRKSGAAGGMGGAVGRAGAALAPLPSDAFMENTYEQNSVDCVTWYRALREIGRNARHHAKTCWN